MVHGLLLPTPRRGLFEATTSESTLISIKEVTMVLAEFCAAGVASKQSFRLAHLPKIIVILRELKRSS